MMPSGRAGVHISPRISGICTRNGRRCADMFVPVSCWNSHWQSARAPVHGEAPRAEEGAGRSGEAARREAVDVSGGPSVDMTPPACGELRGVAQERFWADGLTLAQMLNIRAGEAKTATGAIARPVSGLGTGGNPTHWQ